MDIPLNAELKNIKRILGLKTQDSHSLLKGKSAPWHTTEDISYRIIRSPIKTWNFFKFSNG